MDFKKQGDNDDDDGERKWNLDYFVRVGDRKFLAHSVVGELEPGFLLHSWHYFLM